MIFQKRGSGVLGITLISYRRKKNVKFFSLRRKNGCVLAGVKKSSIEFTNVSKIKKNVYFLPSTELGFIYKQLVADVCSK
jgi:hypothetical protein